MKKKPANKETSITRSSAVEYLTFVAAQGQGGVEVVYANEDIWLTQKMMGILYDVETHTINYHLKKIFADKELGQDSVVRKFRITAADGKNYDTGHYGLTAIIAVGYKVNSERAVQFRKWATSIVKEFTVKGFAMDEERLKAGGWDYCDELLARIREKRRRPAGVLDKRSRATGARRVRRRVAASNQIRAARRGFLEQAELRAKQRKDLTLDFWRSSVDRMLTSNDQPLLEGPGPICHEAMKAIAAERCDDRDAKRRQQEAIDADAEDLKAIENLEKDLKRKGGSK
jgi:hypothetical protein